jgi:hypothetical protein
MAPITFSGSSIIRSPGRTQVAPQFGAFWRKKEAKTDTLEKAKSQTSVETENPTLWGRIKLGFSRLYAKTLGRPFQGLLLEAPLIIASHGAWLLKHFAEGFFRADSIILPRWRGPKQYNGKTLVGRFWDWATGKSPVKAAEGQKA